MPARLPALRLPGRLRLRRRPRDGGPDTPAAVSRDIRDGIFLRSIFRKALRDSRTGFVVSTFFGALLVVVAGQATKEAFGTAVARVGVVAMARDFGPVISGMFGGPLDVSPDGTLTLGALFAWRYGGILMAMLAVWSIVALSGTLLGEARTGSLEFLAATPRTRARIALEKLLAHLALVGLLAAVVTATLVYAGGAYATLPGDEISLAGAVGYAALLAVTMLAAGGVAFALAPFVGRGAAAGIAAAVMVGMYVINGYRESVPAFVSLSSLSWFGWAADHRPLAGLYDWRAVAAIAALAIVLFAIGIVGFVRRDLARTVGIRTPALPGFLVGLRGPARRSFGERLPAALWWGIGIGAYALLIAATGTQIADAIAKSPQAKAMVDALLPSMDLSSAGGVMQFVFVELGVLFFGLAAALLAGGWASDEGSGRLELVLANPLARFAWAFRSGLGLLAAILALTVVVSGAVGIGASTIGGDTATPMLGVFALGLFAAAIAGIGVAVGGLWRSGLAAPGAAAYVVGAFLLQLFGPILRLPDALSQLALGTHLGQPMVGAFDLPGIVICLVLAFGGLALGAWGMARRDLER